MAMAAVIARRRGWMMLVSSSNHARKISELTKSNKNGKQVFQDTLISNEMTQHANLSKFKSELQSSQERYRSRLPLVEKIEESIDIIDRDIAFQARLEAQLETMKKERKVQLAKSKSKGIKYLLGIAISCSGILVAHMQYLKSGPKKRNRQA